MTTIRQLIHSSPKRANELFAKLVDTSETAIKTRDRLFSELKNELELQAELEEQHLFPVLKKHKETKDLAAEALKDNRQTRKLLAELESTPKDSAAFGAKVVPSPPSRAAPYRIASHPWISPDWLVWRSPGRRSSPSPIRSAG